MDRFKYQNKISRVVCLLLMMIVASIFRTTPALSFELLIGTSKPGTFSYFTGRLIERIADKDLKEISIQTIPASGDIHNLTNLIQGSLDLALVDSRMLYDAVNKSGNFEFLDIDYDNLNLIVPLYDVPVTLITGPRANIKKLNDLDGKRVNAGAPLSIQHLTFETILAAKGWSKQTFMLVAELSHSQSQDTMAFCHGSIDAMIHIGIHPDTALEQLFRLCSARAADMDDKDIDTLVKGHPAFLNLIVKPGTYPGQSEKINTFGTQTFLVCSRDLDEQTVMTLLGGIYQNREKLSHAHPALDLKKPDMTTFSDAGLNYHPGAVKYFK